MNKNKLLYSTLGTAALAVPIALVASSKQTNLGNLDNVAKTNQSKTSSSQLEAFDAQALSTPSAYKNYGSITAWATKSIFNSSPINVMTSDDDNYLFMGGSGGTVVRLDHQTNKQITVENLIDKEDILALAPDYQGGFFAAGNNGKINHVLADGTIDKSWPDQIFLNGESINVMHADKMGGIWIAGNKGEIDHLDQNGKSLFTTGVKYWMDGSDIFAMTPDEVNGFWIGGAEGKFAHVDVQGNTSQIATVLDGKAIRAIAKDGNGGLLIAGESDRIDHVDANGKILNPGSNPINSGSSISSITPIGDNTFFVGGANGELALVDQNGEMVANWNNKILLDKASITGIVSDGFGGFFVSGVNGQLDRVTDKGLLYGLDSWIIKASKREEAYAKYDELLSRDWTSANILNRATVQAAIADNESGFVAIGERGAIMHYLPDGNPDPNWVQQQALSGNNVRTIVSDNKGGYLIAGANSKIEQIDGPSGYIIHDFDNPLGYDVYKIISDGKDGFVMIGGNGSFAHIDAKGNVLALNNLQGNYNDIISDSQGNFFVVGANGQLNKIDVNGNVVTNWKMLNLIDNQAINVILPDGQGNFIVVGNQGYFQKIDADGNSLTKPIGHLMNNNDISSVMSDGQGNFFLAGRNGSFAKIDANGLPLTIPGADSNVLNGQNVNALLPDDQGGFWVMGGEGRIEHLNGDGAVGKAETTEDTFARWLSFSQIILDNNISPQDFGIFGKDTEGSIAMLPNVKALPRQLEVQYSIDKGSNWTEAAPTNLTNNDVVKIRLAVKDNYKDYMLYRPSEFDLTVAGLQPKVTTLTDTIAPTDFSFSGTNWNATTNFNKSIAPQLEVWYSLDGGITWSLNKPTNIKNNDLINAKLAVKEADRNDYVLDQASQGVVDITVSGLGKMVLQDSLTANDFAFEGNNGEGKVVFVKTDLSPELEVLYSFNGEHYTNVAPTDFKNGDEIKVKIGFKGDAGEDYELTNNGQQEVVLSFNLAKRVLNDTISARDFMLQGTTGSGTVIFEPSIALSDQLEVRYSLDSASWDATLPVNLANGETLYAKLFVKQSQSEFYELTAAGEQVVSLPVNLDKQKIHYAIDKSHFTLGGTSLKGTITFNDVANMPSQLEVQYSLNGSAWTISAPINLKSGDKIMTRLAVKDADKDNFELDPQDRPALDIDVVLPKNQVNYQITPADFSFAGDAFSGGVEFRPQAQGAAQIDIEYSLDGGNTWSQTLQTLFNGQVIKAKALIKPVNANDYELTESSGKPIDLTVENLYKIILKDVISPSDFVFSGEDNKGTVSLDDHRVISSHLQVEYQFQDPSWSTIAPTNLKNGDTLQARLSVKDDSKLNYDVASSQITLTAKDLPFKIKLLESISESDFVIGGYENLGTIMLSENKWLPEQLVVSYSLNDADWQESAPINLKNTDVVRARLTFNPKDKDNNDIDYSQHYEIVNAAPIEITIKDLKQLIADGGRTIPVFAWVLTALGAALVPVAGLLIWKAYKKNPKLFKKRK